MLSNRGANGIDGTVSTAYGVAAGERRPRRAAASATSRSPTTLGGLLAGAAPRRCRSTIVLLNNDGGGIFDFLPVAGEHDVFEEHVATPHGLDFAHARRVLRVRLRARRRPRGRRRGARRRPAAPAIVEVRTDRAENLALHRRATEAALGAIA